MEAARRRATYRSILGCNLALQFALGILMLAAQIAPLLLLWVGYGLQSNIIVAATARQADADAEG